jgi:hypothetical protein
MFSESFFAHFLLYNENVYAIRTVPRKFTSGYVTQFFN